MDKFTQYYWRVNARNSIGTSDWSEVWTFTTESTDLITGTVTDIDGNVYRTVKIGDQWWMAENLRVTRYSNGDGITNVTDDVSWKALNDGAFCSVQNDENNVDIYGLLYNWYAVIDIRNIAPEGWHVPDDEEWKQLEMYLGMSQSEANDTGWRGTDEGGKLKSMGTEYWLSPNTGATNESGFSALPAGGRDDDTGRFYNIGRDAFFWTATRNYSWGHRLNYGTASIRREIQYKQSGFSVRCIMGEINPPLAPNLVSPSNNSSGQTLNPTLTWDASDGATTCTLQVSTNSVFSTFFFDGDVGNVTSKIISGLDNSTEYYWRVNAKNAGGISEWSEVWTFTTESSDLVTGTVTDIDGNVYKTVKIGDQWWMAENLKVTHYRNGDPIQHVNDNSEWADLYNTGAWCVYDNKDSYKDTYGLLYNWYAVDDIRDIAPEGWHVPSDEDWKKLEIYLGMSQEEANNDGYRGTDEGGKLKETGTEHWKDPNTGATNESGFTALPGEYRDGYTGDFEDFGFIGWVAYFWSSTGKIFNSTAWGRRIYYNGSVIGRYHFDRKGGCSIRCLKD